MKEFRPKYISFRCNYCIHRHEQEKNNENKHCKDCLKMIQKVEMQNFERDKESDAFMDKIIGDVESKDAGSI